MSSLQLSAKDYPVKSVTIYKSSRAEVVRSFPVELKTGQNTIEIGALASTIDQKSVRVSGLGEARLFDVVCKLGTSNAARYASTEVLRQLHARKVLLERNKRVQDHEADVLLQYAKSLSGEHVSPPQVETFLQTFVKTANRNNEQMAAIDEELVQIEREIEAETTKIGMKKGSCNGEITAVIRASEPAAIEMLVTYIVTETSWSPTYELHATTDNGKPSSKVHLHYHARIRQATGEDWSDARLTLNTSQNGAMDTTIPNLYPIKLRAARSNWNKGGAQAPTMFKPTGSGLFASNNNNQVVSGGLFGQPANPPSTAQAGSFSSFGTFGAHPQQQQQHSSSSGFGGGSSLFGSIGTNSAFGARPQQQQPLDSSPSSGFGGGGGSLFGGFGANAATQQTNAPPDGTSSVFGAATTLAAQTPSEAGGDDFEEILLPDAPVKETPLAMSFNVEGKSSIPSDDVEHKVFLNVFQFDTALSYIIVPRIDRRVFLQCKVRNTSEYRLLPGFVRVIMDNSFVSYTRIADVATGDTFDCTLGDDPTTKVTYSRKSDTTTSEGGAFSESFKRTTFTTVISVQNKHPFAIENLIVRDALPTVDDARMKVILQKPEALSNAKEGEKVKVKVDSVDKNDVKTKSEAVVCWSELVDDKGGEKEGKFQWKLRIDPTSRVTLETQWVVKFPSDLILSETSFGGMQKSA
ncbi:hypothetical protein CYLTODRAFT_487803 [Cylindrobasidium torrendii FP15055 ss-10]|uniref:DUF4139 domain-containing protein n=1 Tax=Cylindrobasidium torrendii FP15055 ss-10 TaxID=1314674 RepID=A0A0D7BJZ7_9AGAR|nr:hypothetical protein CYLTODRAFT_487803 [Cylindrobasidium torrendii FP15055 ss-10]